MLRKSWIFLFVLIFCLHLGGLLSGNENLQILTKPLLIPPLIGYLLVAARPLKPGGWVVLGLFFSWIGDMLLMFANSDEIFFLLGLSAFLLAHVFYIVFFHKVRLTERIRGNAWLLIAVTIYYAVLISLLSPFLGDMKLPVRIYGLVISFMLMLALHMIFLRKKGGGVIMAVGAVLFVVSDSILAVNKFYRPLADVGFLIMLSYGLAQYFISTGAARYLSASNMGKSAARKNNYL
jgi:uncharacterized membrane protein YhhN